MNDSFGMRPTILIVDADPLTLTGVAAALHLSGYEAHCARDSEAAMKAAQRLSLDLVICDVNLEGESGIELAERIQGTELNRDVPLMFVSASQAPDIIRRSHASTGVYYLRKPFDPNVLLELVDRALWMPHLVRNQLEAQGQAPVMPLTMPTSGIEQTLQRSQASAEAMLEQRSKETTPSAASHTIPAVPAPLHGALLAAEYASGTSEGSY